MPKHFQFQKKAWNHRLAAAGPQAAEAHEPGKGPEGIMMVIHSMMVMDLGVPHHPTPRSYEEKIMTVRYKKNNALWAQ